MANALEASPATRVLVLRPTGGFGMPSLSEVWAYRELLGFLVWRDVKVRYKQTVLGAAWAIVQPLTTMIVFSVVFGGLAKLPSGDVPYTVFTLTALVPWQLFSQALSEASHSLVANQHLVTKVYFPRLIVPIAAVLVGLVDFAIVLLLLGGLLWYHGIVPGMQIVALPFFLLLAMGTALAAGLWLTSLNVRYRDVRYVIPFLTQVWLFATPVAYASNLVPEQWRALYVLNPLVAVVDGFRWALLQAPAPDAVTVAVSATVVLVVLVGGLVYFGRTERTLADVI